MTRRGALGLALLALAVAAALVRGASADWTLVEERHFAHSLAGEPCGRGVERVEREGDRIRTSSRLELRFRRNSEETRVDQRSDFIETSRGEPLEATVWRGDEVAVRYRFRRGEGATWRVDVERDGRAGTSTTVADDFLTPRGIAAFVAARHAAGAAEIRYRALEVEAGLVPVDVELDRGEPARFVHAGREIGVVRYVSRTSLLDAAGTELIDATGRSVESSVALSGLGTLVARLATAEEAARSLELARFDLLAATFVRSRPIAGWRELARLELEVADAAGELADLPSLGAQVVERLDRARLRIEVDVGRGSPEVAGDRADPRWLGSTELVDHEHEAVRALVARAPVAADAGEFETAEAFRRLVAGHVRDKNLATALGSASEAARSRAGDCTEHAVLLTALLRARGIPARLASGLVYVPDLGGEGPGWGWHLWTQALVETPGAAGVRAWFDFDATLDGKGRGFHAAHLLVATTDLAGGATDPAFARAVGMLGALRIEVREPDSGGQRAP